MSSSIRVGLAGLLLLVGISGLQATQNPPPAQNPPATPPPATPPAQPAGGSAQPGPGRGGRGNPAAGLVAQFCASCHGPTLQGGSATSLMDEDWKFGGDDASITASIRDGRPGTAMTPFKDLITEEQIRQLVFYIRDQAGQLKGKPETKVDPRGRDPQNREADGQARGRGQGSRNPVGHRVPSRRANSSSPSGQAGSASSTRASFCRR